MEFFHRAAGRPRRLGILPGTFNPITTAHMALARAAASTVCEVVFVLPRIFPHKEYSGVDFDTRMEILSTAVAPAGPFSTATSAGGLFRDIARECREAYGEEVSISFLCGRDAAERIVNWKYPEPDACARMLREFDLLVAARQGEYNPPPEFAHAIHRLDLGDDFHVVSATEVRKRITRGEPWEHLVPAAVHENVRRAYRNETPLSAFPL